MSVSRMCSSKSSGRSCFALPRAMGLIVSTCRRRNAAGTPHSPGHARFRGVSGPDVARTPDLEAPAPPKHWEADVLLRDGRTAHIRPIRPDDREVFLEFYSRVSDQSKYFRFFSPMPRLSDRDIDRFIHVDHVDRVAFVLTLQGQIIAVGRYDVT